MQVNTSPSGLTIRFEQAGLEDIGRATEAVECRLEELGSPMRAIVQINVAIDEIFSNIVRYAYPDGSGPVTLTLTAETEPKRAILSFCDAGIPYDPLQREDPDVTLSAEERAIGGLGIFMVKKSMDCVSYRYENGQNILTITKNLE